MYALFVIVLHIKEPFVIAQDMHLLLAQLTRGHKQEQHMCLIKCALIKDVCLQN